MHYGDSVVIVNASLVAGYGGQEVRDWPNATRTTVVASVQPDLRHQSTEEVSRTDAATTHWRTFCGPSAPVGAFSRIEWNGHTYEIVGEPELWKASGRPHHLELRMNRVVMAEDEPT